MKKPLKQLPTRVWRTYRGGKLLEAFLGYENPVDGDYPEDWISSFTEAKNPKYVEKEGVSRIEEGYLTEYTDESDFGVGRSEPELLTKLLDSGERLGVQVHPTDAFAKLHFGTPFGKTECWHILSKRSEDACVYLGFKPDVTKEKWKSLFEAQDIPGMLDCLHKFTPEVGDTILVRGGMPHAIGAGLFLLEIQQPCDYTMRTETTTAYGTKLTPMQIHYGLGVEKMLDCFAYNGLSFEETKASCFLKHPAAETKAYTLMPLVTYEDTPFFALEKVDAWEYSFTPDTFLSVVVTAGEGTIACGAGEIEAKKGDKFFVPYGAGTITLKNISALLCYPPKKGD